MVMQNLTLAPRELSLRHEQDMSPHAQNSDKVYCKHDSAKPYICRQDLYATVYNATRHKGPGQPYLNGIDGDLPDEL